MRIKIAICALVLAGLAAPAFWPGLAGALPPDDDFGLEAVNAPPSLGAAPSGAVHPLGTDTNGRDLLARLLEGARRSFALSAAAALAAVALGILLGVPAGYFGGRLETWLVRATEVLYGLPHLLFVLVLVSAWGPSAGVLIGTLGAFQGLTLARILRLETRAAAARPFVEAAHALGAGAPRILRRHVLPALSPVILAYGLLSLPTLVLQESFLGFLGVSPDRATLGGLLAEGQATFSVYPWQVLAPGIYLTLALGALTILAEGLRPASRGPAGRAA